MADKTDLRNAILSAAKPLKKQLEFFGQTVELRQPSMREILKIQEDEDRVKSASQMIINYLYDPKSGKRVFEDTDIEMIGGLPFGQDMQRMQTAINELMGLDVEEAEKN